MEIASDIRLALRLLLGRRWSVLTALGIVVLGLSTSAAVFIVLDALVLKQLPFRDPEQLFVVGRTMEQCHGGASFLQKAWKAGIPGPVTHSEIQEILQLPGVTEVFGYSGTEGIAKPEFKEAEGLRDAGITPSFFEALGVRPVHGRVLTIEDVGVVPRPVLISYSLWHGRFGQDFGIIGQTVTLGGSRVQVVGIMPKWFNFPSGANIWGASIARNASHIAVVRVAAGRKLPPQVRLSSGAYVTMPLQDFLKPERSEVLSLAFLFMTSGVVLAITWVHLGALQAVHVFDRAKETAVRMAMGATPSQVIRQQIVENLLFVLVAFAAALAVLPSVVNVAALLLPPSVTVGREIAVDYRGMLFLGLATLFGMLAMSLGPIRATARADVLALLKNEGQVLSNLSSSRRRSAVLIAQVALVSAMLYVTGLLTTELMRMRRLDLGFNPDNLLVVKAPSAKGGEASRQQQRLLLDYIKKIPGVVAAAAGIDPYFTGVMPIFVSLDALPPSLDANRSYNAMYQFASPEYFKTVGASIIEGREFDWNLDRGRSVVILSQSLASTLGHPRGLVGSTIWSSQNNSQVSVIGVVGDTRADATNPLGNLPYLYLPDFQGSNLVVRVNSDRRAQAIEQIKSVVHSVTGRNDRLWILDAREKVEAYLAPHKSRVALVGLQAGTALLLGLVGLYSLACEVLRRRLRSAAIRKAFGAPARYIVAHVSTPVVTSAGCGLLLGLGLGITVGQWLATSALIASTSAAIDAQSMGLAVLLVLMSLFLALIGPARRAVQLDPALLLRLE